MTRQARCQHILQMLWCDAAAAMSCRTQQHEAGIATTLGCLGLIGLFPNQQQTSFSQPTANLTQVTWVVRWVHLLRAVRLGYNFFNIDTDIVLHDDIYQAGVTGPSPFTTLLASALLHCPRNVDERAVLIAPPWARRCLPTLCHPAVMARAGPALATAASDCALGACCVIASAASRHTQLIPTLITLFPCFDITPRGRCWAA